MAHIAFLSTMLLVSSAFGQIPPYPPGVYQVSAAAGFPPSAMNSSTQTIGGIQYALAASTSWNGGCGSTPLFAFDKTAGISPPTSCSLYWQSVSAYSTGTGLYYGSNSLGGFAGEWVQIYMSVPLQLFGYSIQSRTDTTTQAPRSWKMLASNDNQTWVSVDSHTGVGWAFGQTQFFQAFSGTAYHYWAIVISATGAQYGTACIWAMQLFGTLLQNPPAPPPLPSPPSPPSPSPPQPPYLQSTPPVPGYSVWFDGADPLGTAVAPSDGSSI